MQATLSNCDAHAVQDASMYCAFLHLYMFAASVVTRVMICAVFPAPSLCAERESLVTNIVYS
jgi:hypothetical protein